MLHYSFQTTGKRFSLAIMRKSPSGFVCELAAGPDLRKHSRGPCASPPLSDCPSFSNKRLDFFLAPHRSSLLGAELCFPQFSKMVPSLSYKRSVVEKRGQNPGRFFCIPALVTSFFPKEPAQHRHSRRATGISAPNTSSNVVRIYNPLVVERDPVSAIPFAFLGRGSAFSFTHPLDSCGLKCYHLIT